MFDLSSDRSKSASAVACTESHHWIGFLLVVRRHYRMDQQHALQADHQWDSCEAFNHAEEVHPMTIHTNPNYGPLFAAARATDPDTSHKAARQVEASGKATTQRDRILAVMARLPHTRHTAGEIARELKDIDRHTVSKRLPELWKSGAIDKCEPRRCTAHGTEMMTWRVK